MKITKNLILIIISIMATLIFSLEIAVTVIEQKNSSVDQMKKYLINFVEKEASELNSDIIEVGNSCIILAEIISNDDTLNYDYYNTLISDELIDKELIFGMGYWFEPYYTDTDVEYYGPYIYKDDDGSTIFSMDYSDEDYDYFSWGWYEDSIEAEDDFNFTEPYYDDLLETTFITESSKIIRDGEVVGITTVDITLREIVVYTTNLDVDGSGEAFILSGNGDVLGEDGITAVEDISGSAAEVEEFIDKITESEEADSKITSDYITVWAPIGDTDMKIVFVMPAGEVMAEIYEQTALSIVLFIASLIVFIIVLNYILKYLIERPLRKIVNYNMMLSDTTDDLDKEYHTELHPNFDNMVLLINRLLDDRNQNIIKLNEKNDELEIKNEEIEALYSQTTAMNDTLNELLDKIRDGYIVTVRSLSNAIEANDKYTKGHCERVTRYAVITAKRFGLSQDEIINLEYAAILHDVGKIGISNNILNKPGKLTDKEYKKIMEHPTIGYEMLKDIEFLEQSVYIIRHHHERVDGKGYPDGLTRDALSLSTKILTVADAYDAMTSSRPYRKEPLSKEEAIHIFESNAGSQFDEEVVREFIKILIEKN